MLKASLDDTLQSDSETGNEVRTNGKISAENTNRHITDFSQDNLSILKELHFEGKTGNHEDKGWPLDSYEAEIESQIEGYGEGMPSSLSRELHREARFWKSREGVTVDEAKAKVQEVKELQNLAYRDHRTFHRGEVFYGRGYGEEVLQDWIDEAVDKGGTPEEIDKRLDCIARINGDLNGLFALNKFGVGKEGEKGDDGLKILFDTLNKGETVKWLRSLGIEVFVTAEGGDESGIYLKGRIPLNSAVTSSLGDGIPEDLPEFIESFQQTNGRPPTILESFIELQRKEIESEEVSDFLDYENTEQNEEKKKLQEIVARAGEICTQRREDGDHSLDGYKFKFRLSSSFGAVTAAEALKTVRFDPSMTVAENNRLLRNEMFHLADARALAFKEQYKGGLKDKDPFLWLLYSKGDIDALKIQVGELRDEVEELKSEILSIDPSKKEDIDKLMEASVEDAINLSPSIAEAPERDEQGKTFDEKLQEATNLPGYRDVVNKSSSVEQNAITPALQRVQNILNKLPSALVQGVQRDINFCRLHGVTEEEIASRVELRKSYLDRAYKDPRPSIPDMYRGDFAKLRLADQLREMLSSGEVSTEKFDRVIVTGLFMTGMKLVNDTGSHEKGDMALERGAFSQKEGTEIRLLNAERVRTTAYVEKADQFWQVVDAQDDTYQRSYPELVRRVELEGFMSAAEQEYAADLLDWNNEEVQKLAAGLNIKIDPDQPFRLSMIPGSSSLKHSIMNLDPAKFETFDDFLTATVNETFRVAQENAEFVKKELIKQVVRKSNPQAYLGVARNAMDAFENERTMLFSQKDTLREMLREVGGSLESQRVSYLDTVRGLYGNGLERPSRTAARDVRK